MYIWNYCGHANGERTVTEAVVGLDQGCVSDTISGQYLFDAYTR